MGIKKRNKVSAEFNMSSLTDIIFLVADLLHADLVAGGTECPEPEIAGQFKDQGSRYLQRSMMCASPRKETITSMANGSGSTDLEEALCGSRARKGSAKKMNITISPDKGAATEDVVAVMDIAMRYDINGILSTSSYDEMRCC